MKLALITWIFVSIVLAIFCCWQASVIELLTEQVLNCTSDLEGAIGTGERCVERFGKCSVELDRDPVIRVRMGVAAIRPTMTTAMGGE